jgi:starch phosphorylase
MVRDYLNDMYEPIAAQSDALAADRHARARELTAWKQRVTAAWPEVKVEVDPDLFIDMVALDDEREVTAEVHLGSLTTDDVAVELLHGPVVAVDELAETQVVRLECIAPSGGTDPAGERDAGTAGEGSAATGVVRYRGRFKCDQAGRHGYAVRVLPAHRDLVVPVEMGCVAWA